MLLASRSSDSMRARSPLAAMAVIGSMRQRICTTVANRILRCKFLKLHRISSKSNTGRPDSAANFCRGWRYRHLFAAAPKGKSLKTRAAAFGRRAAIPDAWLLSRYRLRFSLKCSRCLRRESLPSAHRTARHPPTGRLTVVLYSWVAGWTGRRHSRGRERHSGQFSIGVLRQSPRPAGDGAEPLPSVGAVRPAAKRQTGKVIASPKADSDPGQLSAGQILSAMKLPPGMDATPVGQARYRNAAPCP